MATKFLRIIKPSTLYNYQTQFSSQAFWAAQHPSSSGRSRRTCELSLANEWTEFFEQQKLGERWMSDTFRANEKHCDSLWGLEEKAWAIPVGFVELLAATLPPWNYFTMKPKWRTAELRKECRIRVDGIIWDLHLSIAEAGTEYHWTFSHTE